MRLSSSPYKLLSVTLLLAILPACSRDPNVRKQKFFQSGQRYFEKGQYHEAALQFGNALRIDPSYADAHYQLAQSCLKSQQWSCAFQEFSQTIELQPENSQARIELANLLIMGRNFPQAREQTDLLLKQWPNDPGVHVVVSNLLGNEGNFAGALTEMQKAIALDPNRWESFVSLGLLQVKNNQADAAETSFKSAVAVNPKGMAPRLMLASYYQSRGQFGNAEQQFREAIANDPKSSEPRGALARLYLAEGKKPEAEEFLRQAKRDFPDDSVGYRMLGDFYLATGDLDKAVAEYAFLNQEHPKDPQVKKNYIQALIMKSRFDEARKLNDEILKESPQDNDALVYRGQIQIGVGNLSDASSTLQAVVKNDPDNGLGHYYLGIALDRSGSPEQAESEWREAARLRPELAEVQRALAGVAVRKRDMGALEQAATQMITLQPASPDGYALRIISYINRKQFDNAEKDIRHVIEVAPQSPVGYVQLGSLRFVQKQYSEAGKAYQQALERDVNSVDALRGLMNTYLAQNQVDKAILAANAQIAKAADNSGFYNLLGTALFNNKKDLNAAEAAFKKAAGLNKNNVDALVKLGQVLTASGKLDEAIASYQQSIRDNPRQATFFVLLGQVYESRQDWNNARSAYQQALEIQPSDPLASNNLAYALLRTGGNVDVALSLAQTARRGMPDSPNAADTLGWVYYQKGAYQLAIGQFQEALKLGEKSRAPENPNVHYHLGLAYEKTNQPALARRHLERALKISPNYSDAADVKKQLAQLKS
ncbi:MAG: tetratricopeptide repeat protein [Acidobacteriia bacterium]|nr:tetratricopeptide repeat protein [Terriglobia bacterium]